MSGKVKQKTSFKLSKTIDSVFTGGKAILTEDGSTLITTVNHLVHVSDMHTLRIKAILHGDGEPITAVAISPDGTQLAIASQSLRLRLYDLSKINDLSTSNVSPSMPDSNTTDFQKLSSELLVREWKSHDAPVTVMAFHPDHPSLLATGSADTTVRVWDVTRSLCTHLLRGHPGILTCLRFVSSVTPNRLKTKKDDKSPNGTSWFLFSASEDGQIRQWDLVSRECTALLEGHTSAVRALDFTKDGHSVSAGRDKVIHIWKVKLGKIVLDRTLPVFESLDCMCIINKSSSSPLVLVGGENGNIRVFDLASWTLVFEEKRASEDSPLAHLRGIADATYSATSSSVLLVRRDHTLNLVSAVDFTVSKHILGHLDDVVDVKHLDASNLAIVTNSERLTIMDVTTMDTYFLEGHTDMILSMDLSADKSIIITGSKDNTARIWTKDPSGRFICATILHGHTEAVTAVSFNRKKGNAFVLTGSQDRTIKLWIVSPTVLSQKQVASMRAEYTIKAHDKDINAIDVSPNDKVFATASQDKTVKIFSVADGQLVSTLRGHKRGVWSVAFSPIDQCVVTASGDKTVKLWSVANSTCLKSFEGHLNSVLKAQFINEGTQIASAGGDGLLKIWTIKTNECITTLDNHEDRIWAISTFEEEKEEEGKVLSIVSGGADARISIWQDVTQEEEEAKIVKEEQVILKEQDLSNYLLRKDYKNAIVLAMELDQPYRIFQLFESVANQREDSASITGSLLVDDILTKMNTYEVGRLLTYIRDWNTRTRTSRIAQTVLFSILKAYPANSLINLPPIKDLIEALLPYTERHFQRSCQLMSDAYMIDFTLSNMDVLLNGNDEEVVIPDLAKVTETIENGDQSLSGALDSDDMEIIKMAEPIPVISTRGSRKRQKTVS